MEVNLDKPEPLLPTLIATVAICSPNTPVGKATRNPIGTGPYIFEKWHAGTQIILERFDGYWGKQPQVKKAVYAWRGESLVRAEKDVSMIDRWKRVEVHFGCAMDGERYCNLLR